MPQGSDAHTLQARILTLILNASGLHKSNTFTFKTFYNIRGWSDNTVLECLSCMQLTLNRHRFDRSNQFHPGCTAHKANVLMLRYPNSPGFAKIFKEMYSLILL